MFLTFVTSKCLFLSVGHPPKRTNSSPPPPQGSEAQAAKPDVVIPKIVVHGDGEVGDQASVSAGGRRDRKRHRHSSNGLSSSEGNY